MILRHREGGDRLFSTCSPPDSPSSDYLQEPLQQLAHFPSKHFWQEVQLVLQHLAQALSEAVAVAMPRPAMMASRAPALIDVFMVVCVWLLVIRSGNHSRSTK